jgi:hypothetical protein
MQPSVNNGRRSGGGQSSPPGLEQQAEMQAPQLWKTPHGFANTDQYGKTGGGGGEFQKQVRLVTGKPKLNPAFVGYLMGLPPAWTSSGPTATAFAHWQQRMRSALSWLVRGVDD